MSTLKRLLEHIGDNPEREMWEKKTTTKVSKKILERNGWAESATSCSETQRYRKYGYPSVTIVHFQFRRSFVFFYLGNILHVKTIAELEAAFSICGLDVDFDV